MRNELLAVLGFLRSGSSYGFVPSLLYANVAMYLSVFANADVVTVNVAVGKESVSTSCKVARY